MSESLPYGANNFDRNVEIEDILKTPDDSDIGCFVGVDLKYPDNVKKKQKIFHLILKMKKLVLMISVVK